MSKYWFYYRWMTEVSMSVFPNHIWTVDASSWQNKCPELFSSLASILINFDWTHKMGIRMILPPLRYPQPVGAAWDPKSFNDSFDFFPIDLLESVFSFGLGLAKIFLREFICLIHININMASEEFPLFQIIDLRSFDILVSIARIDWTWTQRH